MSAVIDNLSSRAYLIPKPLFGLSSFPSALRSIAYRAFPAIPISGGESTFSWADVDPAHRRAQGKVHAGVVTAVNMKAPCRLNLRA